MKKNKPNFVRLKRVFIFLNVWFLIRFCNLFYCLLGFKKYRKAFLSIFMYIAVILSLRSFSEVIHFNFIAVRTFLLYFFKGEHLFFLIYYFIFIMCGYRLMVNSLSSTQMIWVRFPLSAYINNYAYLVKLVNTTDLKSVPLWLSVQVR